mgnify:CR=1 FL=1
MGPTSRYLGSEVPKDDLIWQDPIPKFEDELVNTSDISLIKKKISVIGAGAWGTALANLLSKNGHETLIWALEEDCAASIFASRMLAVFNVILMLIPGLTRK